MERLNTSTGIGWLNLDSWSETYIGAYWIIENRLPESVSCMEPVDGPLSQMVVIASHQLIEITIFGCIQAELERMGQWNDTVASFVHRMRFNEAFNKWPRKLTNQKFPKTHPFTAARELAERRNATIHSESALATPKMARSALYTGVETSRAIQVHFRGAEFSYERVLQKYPVQDAQWFSKDLYPENT